MLSDVYGTFTLAGSYANAVRIAGERDKQNKRETGAQQAKQIKARNRRSLVGKISALFDLRLQSPLSH